MTDYISPCCAREMTGHYLEAERCPQCGDSCGLWTEPKPVARGTFVLTDGTVYAVAKYGSGWTSEMVS